MKGLVTALHKSGEYDGRKWYQISVMETGKKYAMKGITNDDPSGYLGKKDELDMVCNETPTNTPNPHKPGTTLINRNFILPNNPNIHIAREQAHSTTPQTGNVSPQAEKGYSKAQLDEVFAKFRKELNDMQNRAMRQGSKIQDLEHEISLLSKPNESHATTHVEMTPKSASTLPPDVEEPEPEPDEEDLTDKGDSIPF